MQAADHRECQRSLAGQHLVDAVAAPDEWNEVSRRQRLLLHMVLDRFYGVGQAQRIMLSLPSLHKSDKHVEAVALRCVPLRGHQTLDFLEGASVVAMRFDWCDIHCLILQIVCASMESYCLCVPMNRCRRL